MINVLHKNYEGLLEMFEELIDEPGTWDDETLDKVSGLRHYLVSCFAFWYVFSTRF